MTYPDLETRWRQGCTHALRRLPSHVRLTDPDHVMIAARSMVWLVTRAVGVVALVIIALAVAQ